MGQYEALWRGRSRGQEYASRKRVTAEKKYLKLYALASVRNMNRSRASDLF